MEKKLNNTAVRAIVAGHSYVMPQAGIVATLKDSDKPKPTKSVDKDDVGTTSDIAYWGDDNMFPNNWEKDIEANDTLFDAVEREISRIYAGGLEYSYEHIDKETGQKETRYFYSKELEEILYSPAGLHAFEQQIRDYVVHRFPATELYLNYARDKVIGVGGLQATHLRLAKQKKNGYILHSYFCRNWDIVSDVKHETVERLWLLDPLVDRPEDIKGAKGPQKYYYHVPMAGYRTYYHLSPAYTAKTSRWLDISAKTTKTFDYLLTNQMNPKYHVEIDASYMAKKYGDRWEQATPDGINAIMLEELQHFHKMLHGPENSGNNIISTKRIEKLIEKEYSDWTVTHFKGDAFDEKLITLSDTADKHIQRAVGIDPALQGSTGGSKLGGGGGSDKRESFNIQMATAQRHVDHILSVYYWIIKFNGITGPDGAKVKLKMLTPHLPQLNEVTPSKRNQKIEEE